MQRYNFSQIENGKAFAEGDAIHAETMDDALQVIHDRMMKLPTSVTFKFRDNMKCPVGYCKICDSNRAK